MTQWCHYHSGTFGAYTWLSGTYVEWLFETCLPGPKTKFNVSSALFCEIQLIFVAAYTDRAFAECAVL